MAVIPSFDERTQSWQRLLSWLPADQAALILREGYFTVSGYRVVIFIRVYNILRVDGIGVVRERLCVTPALDEVQGICQLIGGDFFLAQGMSLAVDTEGTLQVACKTRTNVAWNFFTQEYGFHPQGAAFSSLRTAAANMGIHVL